VCILKDPAAVNSARVLESFDSDVHDPTIRHFLALVGSNSPSSLVLKHLPESGRVGRGRNSNHTVKFSESQCFYLPFQMSQKKTILRCVTIVSIISALPPRRQQPNRFQFLIRLPEERNTAGTCLPSNGQPCGRCLRGRTFCTAPGWGSLRGRFAFPPVVPIPAFCDSCLIQALMPEPSDAKTCNEPSG